MTIERAEKAKEILQEIDKLNEIKECLLSEPCAECNDKQKR